MLSFLKTHNYSLLWELVYLLEKIKLKQTSIDELVNILDSLKDGISDETDTLKPLFETEEDRIEFRNRHYRTKVKKRDLNNISRKSFLRCRCWFDNI